MPKNAFFTLKPTLLGVLLFLGLFLGRFRHFSGSRWAIPKKWPLPKTRLTRGFTEIWPDWPVATNFLKLSISFTCVLWLNLRYSYIFSFLYNRERKVGKWAKTGLTRGFTTKLWANKWAKWPSKTVKWTKSIRKGLFTRPVRTLFPRLPEGAIKTTRLSLPLFPKPSGQYGLPSQRPREL